VVSLVLAYSLSRCLAASLIFSMNYVTDPDSGKSKPLANNQSRRDLVILLISALPVLFFLSWQSSLTLAILMFTIRSCTKFYFNRQLGGYTGDALGAAQQISELSIYALLLILQQHSGVF